ncbi:hypothetical protein ACHWQZ_G006764 [Mnemiopsis leidyi]
MVGNGDVFNEDNERIIDGTVNIDYSDPTKITSTLTIQKVTADAGGEFNCALRWDGVYLESTPVSLAIRTITLPPLTSFSASGADVKLTCQTVADSAATLTFHTGGGEAVSSVEVETETAGDVVTSTAVLTLPGVTQSGVYYCRAGWGDNLVRSDDVSVSVLDITSSTTTVWGLVGKVAQLACSADVLLKTNTAPFLVDGARVYATTVVTWEYFDTTDSTWKSSDTNSRLVPRTPLTSAEGTRTFSLSLLNIQANDNGAKVRCNVAYQSDPGLSLYGGVVTSGDLTVRLSEITAFTTSSNAPIVGETITLSCSATAETVPEFQFLSSRSRSFNTPYLEPVDSAAVSELGNTYTATLKVKAILANNLRNGETLTCQVDFGAAKNDEKNLVVTNYFDCGSVSVKSYNTEGNGATITTTDLGGGSLKQTITCPPDSSTTKYNLAERANSGQDITCTKETGKYNPPYLAACQPTHAYTYGSGMQKMTLETSAEKPAPCTNEATGEWSITTMKEKLDSLTDTICGFRHAVSCLISGECTLDTNRSGCRYESGKIVMEYFVNFNSPVWTLSDLNDLKKLVGKVKFWECSETYV